MPDNDLIDAKIAASEARTDAKFARLEGQIATLSTDLSAKMAAVLTAVYTTNERVSSFEGKLSGFDGKLAERRAEFKADFRTVRTLMIGLAVSLAGLMLAIVIGVFTVGGAMFSRGMSVRDVVKAVISEQQQSTKTPAASLRDKSP